MPRVHFLRRMPLKTLGIWLVLGCWSLLPPGVRPIDAERFWVVGTQTWGGALAGHAQPAGPFAAGPRVSVFEADAWRHSLKRGTLYPVAQIPVPPESLWMVLKGFLRRTPQTDLLRGADFTPDAYLEQVESLRALPGRPRDILMYYGGLPNHPRKVGLNFNGWSKEDLIKLRERGCRPFIGLETMDRTAIRALIGRLKEAGYGPLDRIYIRIGAEPSYSPYGTEDGTRSGKRHTPAAYAAYKRRFVGSAEFINSLNRRYGLNIHTVFAGASREDFDRYIPPAGTFDAIGYDLYVTPENKMQSQKQMQQLRRHFPYTPMVIPEFGVATAGPVGRSPRADPQWASDALGDILMELGRHPAGVQAITVFSVNVPERISDRRWNWAWTPGMYEMLKEWQASPRTWRKEGFHRYDPMSYPVGRDVVFLNRPDSRIVYRKLAASKSPGLPLFQETCFSRKDTGWIHQVRVIYFTGSEKREYRNRATPLL